jgi:formylglycine-generating enzyme required for sulfatase activity
MPEEPARLDETLDAKPYEPPKKSRSLTIFYVVLGVVVALVLFGFWFWRTWTVWWFDADEAKRRQAEAAGKLGVLVEKAVDLGGGVKLELVLIPGGRFRMGHQVGVDDGEAGYRWVRITKPFYMGKYEVTQEQWEKVMGAHPSLFEGAKNPVDSISWDNCQNFLRKLNQLPTLAPGPSSLGRGDEVRVEFRLPTEAEWEWACRAGTRTELCSGDGEGGLGDYAWYRNNAGDTTHPVGEKKPNAWGLYDMHGNVWEWCGDWYAEYGRGWMPKADPTGPMMGHDRATRGGSWSYPAGNCRSKYRGYCHPGILCDVAGYGGIRLVASSSRTP